MKRFCVISDTHESCGERVIAAIDNYLDGVDGIIHCGDVTGMEVVRSLEAKAPLVLVAGNMDSYDVRAGYPKKEILEVEGNRIGIVHGWGTPHGIVSKVMHEFRTDRVDTIVFGHTHSPMNRNKDGIFLFNPGSLLDRVFTTVNSLGILEVGPPVKGHIMEITP